MFVGYQINIQTNTFFLFDGFFQNLKCKKIAFFNHFSSNRKIRWAITDIGAQHSQKEER